MRKNPSRVWGSFLWLRGSVMRSRQALETHLQRQRDLIGTRERISTRGSSGRLALAAAATLLLEQSMPPRAICKPADQDKKFE